MSGEKFRGNKSKDLRKTYLEVLSLTFPNVPSGKTDKLTHNGTMVGCVQLKLAPFIASFFS